MKTRRAALGLAGLTVCALMAGCATPPARLKDDTVPSWRGRLAVRVQAAVAPEPSPDQSFSAAFELQGSAQQGDLNFFTPLGSTAAAIHWTPTQARLQASGETRDFSSLNQLVLTVLGTDVPVPALFSWLAGEPLEVAGWQVDLSARDQGKITAYRLTPPTAQLRVLLDP